MKEFLSRTTGVLGHSGFPSTVRPLCHIPALVLSSHPPYSQRIESSALLLKFTHTSSSMLTHLGILHIPTQPPPTSPRKVIERLSHQVSCHDRDDAYSAGRLSIGGIFGVISPRRLDAHSKGSCGMCLVRCGPPYIGCVGNPSKSGAVTTAVLRARSRGIHGR